MALWLHPERDGEFGPEPRPGHRVLAWLGLAVVLVLLGLLLWWHNVPAHGGVDQNGYLVQGKILLETGTAGRKPADAYEFVGRMWIGADLGTEQERYFAKYPLGLPALVAAGRAVFGAEAAYWISPLGMLVGVGATFWMVRLFCGPMLAMIAAALVGLSPSVVGLGTNPNSHGAALGATALGMALVLSWAKAWDGQRAGGRRRSWIMAAAAGLVLGFAVTVRYTDGLLVLPMAVALLLTMRRSWAWWGQAALLGATWCAVVGGQVAFNLAAFGSFTGYDPTNESVGFSLAYAVDNWANALRQLDQSGLVMFFPVAVVGLVALWWWHWRLALLMWSWVLPSVLLYTAYYWAPDNNRLSYMRFFLTVVPPLAGCAMVVIARLRELVAAAADGRQDGAFVAGTGAIAGLAVALNLTTALPQLQSDHVQRLALLEQANQVLAYAPAGSVIWSDEESLIRHLQYVGDYQLYYTPLFNRRALERLTNLEPDEPSGLQPQRAYQLAALLTDMTPRELGKVQQTITDAALASGKRVFVAEQRGAGNWARARQARLDQLLGDEDYDFHPVSAWGRPAIPDSAFEAGAPGPQRFVRARGVTLPRSNPGQLREIVWASGRRASVAEDAAPAEVR